FLLCVRQQQEQFAEFLRKLLSFRFRQAPNFGPGGPVWVIQYVVAVEDRLGLGRAPAALLRVLQSAYHVELRGTKILPRLGHRGYGFRARDVSAADGDDRKRQEHEQTHDQRGGTGGGQTRMTAPPFAKPFAPRWFARMPQRQVRQVRLEVFL